MGYEDDYTGLPNRMLFYNRINRAISNAKRRGESLEVILLGQYEYWKVNSLIGNSNNNLLLYEVEKRLKSVLRKCDTVVRIGKDEFLILIQDLLSFNCTKTAERLIDVFKQPFVVDNYEICIGCSIGCAVYPFDGADVETLIINAVGAMCEAKIKGRNQVVFCYNTIQRLLNEPEDTNS